ncbi:sugar-binding transcriptional regulator [Specibacter cremeus]|uniref:sugar-binding transcriptional regulator n=1 Tax=Specibacter cremeus TaxID=1629051 RepID=UPI0013DE0C50|nr:sugar-binding domain-containing protein [Specibacter cremeus]
MRREQPGPDALVRSAYIAHRHFVEGRTRIEIAEETGLSRFKVGRVLDEAVSSGLVTFQIASPSGIDLDLSIKLTRAFTLDRAVAVNVPSEQPEVMQQYLGGTAADLVTEILTDDDVFGLTSGRTINALARALKTLPSCEVVQLAGIAGPIQETGIETIRRVSAIAGVRPWTIYAPLVASMASTAEGLLQQPEIRDTFAQFARVSVAVVAVGSWNPADSQMMQNPALGAEDRDKLVARGVRAEVGATLVGDGGEIIHDLDNRCLAIPEAQLRRIPQVIAVAGGAAKTEAIRAVLASGLVHSLVTDAATARRLIGA